MSNKIIQKISPSVRIIVLVLITVTLLLAKSIYLILFITILTLILFLITNKKVNIYVKFLNKVAILLLFFFVVYIIMFRQYNVLSIIILAYKLILIVILVKIFLLNIDFRSLHEGLYGVLHPLKLLKKVNIEELSFDITCAIYFIKFIMESKEKTIKSQFINGRKTLNVKNYIFPRLFYCVNELNKLKVNLKVKFYKLNYKKSNFNSKIVFVMFLLLFIGCIIKEVIM